MRVCERVKRGDDHISGEGEGDGRGFLVMIYMHLLYSFTNS